MNDTDNQNSLSRKQLLITAMIRFIPGLIIISAILFISAGSIRYWNVWLFIGELFLPIALAIIYLIIRDPELLQKRLDTNEHEKKQKKVILTTSVIILSGLIIAGIDYRYQWSDVPFWMVILSSLVILTGYFLFFTVMRQNSYASRVVEVQANQKVIETGLYAYIRHPMYLASILIFTFIPLSLGSFYALIPMLLFPFQMNSRIENEEEILEKGLDGYTEYKKKVKYKIIPLIW